MSQRCPFCQSEQRDTARYCDQCRNRLSAIDPARLSPADLDRLATKNTALFARAAGMAGFRMVTTLFCDLHGFTAMSEKLGNPEQITTLMNRCFDTLTRAILDRGGTIDKYSGDNIMALFGAPVAHEDDAERAVRAALDMLEALKRFNAVVVAESGVSLEMRVGINTGNVVAGLVGGVSYNEYSYTVMGDPVNLASRLEHSAPVGGILIGQSTYRLTNTVFDYERLPPMIVRGKREPVQAYLVKGVLAQRADSRGLQALNQRVPLVGRSAEQQTLDAALAQALTGQGQVVTIVGEAGLGKTSLIREFTRKIEVQKPNVQNVIATAYPYRTNIPYSLVRNIFFGMAGITETDDEPTTRRKLFALVERLLKTPDDVGGTRYSSNDIADVMALIGEAVGVSFQNAFIETLEPRLRKQLLLDAIHDVVLASAQQGQPLLLVLDDLHWVDVASLEVVDRLLRTVIAGQLHSRDSQPKSSAETVLSTDPTPSRREKLVAVPHKPMPVMLVVLHRPDFVHSWPVALDRLTAITLSRLSVEQSRELARQWLAATRDVRPERLYEHDTRMQATRTNSTVFNLDALIEDYDEKIGLMARLDKLVASANGNPLFIEEIIKALQIDRRLVPSTTAKGGWRLTSGNTERNVPDSLFEILLARIDRLDTATRRLLQIAAVVGQRFNYGLLRSLAPAVLPQTDDVAFDDIFESLISLDFIRKSSRPDNEQEYVFVHSLTQEVAYNNLLEVERKRYHTIVAPTMEQHYGGIGKLHEVLDDLARHYRATDMHEKAVYYLTQVADKRRALYDNDAALRDYTEARTRLERFIPASLERARQLLALNTAIGDLLSLNLDYPGALDSYHHALDSVEAIEGYIAQSETDPVQVVALEAFWRAARLTLWGKVILMLTRKGECDEALSAYREINAMLRTIDDTRATPAERLAKARLLSILGYTYFQLADYERALDAYKAGTMMLARFQPADFADQPDLEQQRQLEQGILHHRIGLVHSRNGNFEATQSHWFVARDIFTGLKDYERLAHLYDNLATLAINQGDWTKTAEYFELADNYAQRSGAKEVMLATLINLGYVRERQGDLVAAASQFNRAARLYDQAGDRLNTAHANVNLGRVLYMQHKLDAAAEALRRSRALAEAAGAPNVTAEGDMYYGAVMLAGGDLDAAETALNQSYATARTIGDSLTMNQVLVYLSQVHLAENDSAAAITLANQVRGDAETMGDILAHGMALRVLGQAYVVRNDLGQAAQMYQVSIRTLTEAVAPFERALAQHLYGTLLAGLPDTRKAKADAPAMLSESYDFFNNNDATGWVLEQQAALTA